MQIVPHIIFNQKLKRSLTNGFLFIGISSSIMGAICFIGRIHDKYNLYQKLIFLMPKPKNIYKQPH